MELKPISKIAAGVHPSTTLTIDALFKQMKAEGKDVVGFGAGEPDFPTPEHIKQAGIDAIENNLTRYTPAAGLMDLRKAASDRLDQDFGLDYAPDQIVVASGAKHSIFIALQTLCDAGDEVVIAAPYWVSYSEMVQQAGAVPVVVTASEEQDFKITAAQLDAAVTDKTKCFMLNSPCNPTGMVYTKDELAAIAEVCTRRNLYVIADEIYCNLVYDNREFTSFASLSEDIRERTILVNGVSKSYAMTGWRIGYSASSRYLARMMANYLSHSTSAPCTISQHAAITALIGPQEDMIAMRGAFEKRRDHLVERMNKVPGVSCIKPEGAFYVMMNMKQFLGKTMYGKRVESAEDFAQLFLEKGLVATVPCTAFAAPGFVRWSYATSMQEIDKGLDRLEEFIKNA
ncbi:pyridoxal phosphate-dependent aminotransferase [Butyricicoccus faecihominis]|uniref:pyridoxal phosphate-dependent aminotransferase n=1 Tax=Butyricicoccaceae TaxID=3085642 RepID=UPI0024791C03|nr:pyridoxal phosphate-dependent aminotransferase [Agathobaculum sp. NTUH-O15-33]MCQ5129683.1 pyridoxal phosphate-dependent aminotransferase [Butyricicoccus faecihominis]WNX85396.1 pyridoxal phosphate-dependent aminotransferase [Agathobaculum sp. NTUH-O15-33]